jgi:hypothetical protein
MPVALLEPFQGEGRASTITQQPLQSRPIMAGNAYRSVKRETAVVPAEHVAGIIAIEQAATRKPTQHPAAYLLGDAGDLLSRQCPRVEEPDLPVVDGLEQAVDDATVVMDVAVERGAETLVSPRRAAGKVRASRPFPPQEQDVGLALGERCGCHAAGEQQRREPRGPDRSFDANL